MYVNEQAIKTCDGEAHSDKIILGNNKVIYVRHIFIQTSNQKTLPNKCLLLSKVHAKEYAIVKYKNNYVDIRYKKTYIYNAVSNTGSVTIEEIALMDLSLKRINLKNVSENLQTITIDVSPSNVYVSRAFVLVNNKDVIKIIEEDKHNIISEATLPPNEDHEHHDFDQ